VRSWKFWEGSTTDDKQADTDAAQSHSLPGRTAPVGEPIPQPVDTPAPKLTRDQAKQRLAALNRRREGILFDLDQAELATMPENPWRERIALYGETIKVVQSDIAALDREPHVSRPTLPTTPIQIETVAPDDPAVVAFDVGMVAFRYESEIDWAERGTTIARGELIRMTGDPAQLVPADMPAEFREELASHLDNSLFIFATDLRRLADEGEPFPDATLSDLAKPCPICGHWQSWGGFCAVCAERANRRRALEAEFMRISAEQSAEEDERAKWVERLPVARRRLADVDAEIALLLKL
jgi:hypothetical protein